VGGSSFATRRQIKHSMKHAFLQEKTKTIARQKTTKFDKIKEKLNKSTKFDK
jgi:hypothetical protein